MKKKKPISEEQHYLCEIGLEKMPYRSSWLFKSYTEESHTHITITAYYNVDEAFLQASTAAWGMRCLYEAGTPRKIKSDEKVQKPCGFLDFFLIRRFCTKIVVQCRF